DLNNLRGTKIRGGDGWTMMGTFSGDIGAAGTVIASVAKGDGNGAAIGAATFLIPVRLPGAKIVGEVGAEIAGAATKQGVLKSEEILKSVQNAASEAAKEGHVAFANDVVNLPLSNIGRIDHSARHLIEAGIITENSGSKAARQAFQDIGRAILTKPIKTFDHVMVQGGQPVKGFYGKINGEDVVIFVAKEPRGKIAAGDIVTAIKPSPQQIKNFGL
ncbi:hypothetical protein, partial [Stenotrophomonas maltophilia]|uniref:hypothetical protein n=2 Tax=Stenotrophomonas maltophilia group TaxID=995085 RepID=UPI0022B7A68A